MKKMSNFVYTCLILDIEDSTNFLIHFIYLSTMFINVVTMINNTKLEGLNFSRISSFWKLCVEWGSTAVPEWVF